VIRKSTVRMGKKFRWRGEFGPLGSGASSLPLSRLAGAHAPKQSLPPDVPPRRDSPSGPLGSRPEAHDGALVNQNGAQRRASDEPGQHGPAGTTNGFLGATASNLHCSKSGGILKAGRFFRW
jgi:hypothetical protein